MVLILLRVETIGNILLRSWTSLIEKVVSTGRRRRVVFRGISAILMKCQEYPFNLFGQILVLLLLKLMKIQIMQHRSLKHSSNVSSKPPPVQVISYWTASAEAEQLVPLPKNLGVVGLSAILDVSPST